MLKVAAMASMFDRDGIILVVVVAESLGGRVDIWGWCGGSCVFALCQLGGFATLSLRFRGSIHCVLSIGASLQQFSRRSR